MADVFAVAVTVFVAGLFFCAVVAGYVDAGRP